MSLPLAQDGLRGDSKVWKIFKAKIFENQNELDLDSLAMLSKSFSLVQEPRIHDKQLWGVIEAKFSEYLKDVTV